MPDVTVSLSRQEVGLILQALNAVQMSGRDARKAVAAIEEKLDASLAEKPEPAASE